jgi:hypothetical protein
MVRVRAVVGDGLEKVVELDGLAKVGRQSESPRVRFPVRETRESHDRDVSKARVGHLAAAKLLAPHSGHLEVEQDHAGLFALAEKRQGFFPALCGDRAIALALDDLPENFEEVPIVVDDENGGRRTVRAGGHYRKSYFSRRKLVSREGLEPST